MQLLKSKGKFTNLTERSLTKFKFKEIKLHKNGVNDIFDARRFLTQKLPAIREKGTSISNYIVEISLVFTRLLLVVVAFYHFEFLYYGPSYSS